jgi:hypothetical protein
MQCCNTQVRVFRASAASQRWRSAAAAAVLQKSRLNSISAVTHMHQVGECDTIFKQLVLRVNIVDDFPRLYVHHQSTVTSQCSSF